MPEPVLDRAASRFGTGPADTGYVRSEHSRPSTGLSRGKFLARSASAPAYRQEHWDLMNDFLTEAREIRGKALRAHNY